MRIFENRKKLLLACLALEIAAFPAAAQIMDKVGFTVPPTVMSAEIPDEDAVSTSYLLASNAAFTISISNAVGEVGVSVETSGSLENGQAFGTASQAPGPVSTCALAAGLAKTRIWTGDRKTARMRGDVVSQAVRITVSHPGAHDAQIEMTPLAETTALPGRPCVVGPA